MINLVFDWEIPDIYEFSPLLKVVTLQVEKPFAERKLVYWKGQPHLCQLTFGLLGKLPLAEAHCGHIAVPAFLFDTADQDGEGKDGKKRHRKNCDYAPNQA